MFDAHAVSTLLFAEREKVNEYLILPTALLGSINIFR